MYLKLLAVLVLVLFISSFSIHAAVIQYVATDLVDTVPGQDLWRYDYTVSGASFLQGAFFDIYSNPSLYGMLSGATAANLDWDVAVLQQPTPGNLPPFDIGIFDSFALTDGPSLSGAFSVKFVYLGSGTPGSQPYDIYDASASLVETGFTTPAGSAIPEPSTWPLVLSGFVALAVSLRRRSAMQH